MKNYWHRIWTALYGQWALWYIRRERIYRHEGLRLVIPPGVFHPGVFWSTPVFVSFLQKIDFQGKKVLDVGTGSGLLALFAARRGARVTALDINPLAAETARCNAGSNGLEMEVLESDLLENLPPQIFDIILVNPPYFAAAPRDAAAHAFFAGENLEYFDRLFRQLPAFSDASTQTWMILSGKCDFDKIEAHAAANSLQLTTVFEWEKQGERLLILNAGSRLIPPPVPR